MSKNDQIADGRVRVGINPLSWMNSDFPHLGAHISVEQCLSELSLIGYEGVELEDRFHSIAHFPRLLAARRIECIGGWHSTLLLEKTFSEEKTRLQMHLDCLQNTGASIVILCDTSHAVHRQRQVPLTKRPRLVQNPLFFDQLDQLANMCHERGFKTAYHHHMGTIVQTAEEIDQLMEHTAKLGLLFDTGHLVFAGGDPLLVLRRHRARITHVHLKNLRAEIFSRLKESSFEEGVLSGIFTVPGDSFAGSLIDFSAIIQDLLQNNYHGWFVVEAEQDPRIAEPFTYAKLAYHTILAELFRHEARLCESELPLKTVDSR